MKYTLEQIAIAYDKACRKMMPDELMTVAESVHYRYLSDRATAIDYLIQSYGVEDPHEFMTLAIEKLARLDGVIGNAN